MDQGKLKQFVDRIWEDEILPILVDYIRIPAKSPNFDANWREHGFLEEALVLFERFARNKTAAIPGAQVEAIRLTGRTPLLLIEIPGTSEELNGRTVLFYGHLDKQPEMFGWAEGRGPWEPVIQDGKLYGRGGGDDGYSLFASLAAILGLHEQNIAHARCVVLIEASEESGSPDLPAYLDHLAARLGVPELVIGLDSGCGNYEQLWVTTSLRGIAMGNLTVRVLTEGVHSGDASGVVPSSFRIVRQLLSRIEDDATGEMKLPELFAPIPPERVAQAKQVADILGPGVYEKFPFAGGTRPMGERLEDMVLVRAWNPQLAVIGLAGYPPPDDAGNVLIPFTTVTLSVRLPPMIDPAQATAALKAALETDPPYGAEVHFEPGHGMTGWDSPPLAPWLSAALETASKAHFGKSCAFVGEGVTIPFMAMLGGKFPNTQFVVTGVLGPHSNAHGPNEFLHISMAQGLSASIASVLAEHAAQGNSVS